MDREEKREQRFQSAMRLRTYRYRGGGTVKARRRKRTVHNRQGLGPGAEAGREVELE